MEKRERGEEKNDHDASRPRYHGTKRVRVGFLGHKQPPRFTVQFRAHPTSESWPGWGRTVWKRMEREGRRQLVVSRAGEGHLSGSLKGKERKKKRHNLVERPPLFPGVLDTVLSRPHNTPPGTASPYHSTMVSSRLLLGAYTSLYWSHILLDRSHKLVSLIKEEKRAHVRARSR
jgi:hypothetical protein